MLVCNIKKTSHIQGKGSGFVVFDSDSYIEKINCRLERSSFQQLDYKPPDKFRKKVTSWVKIWKQNKILEKSWC